MNSIVKNKLLNMAQKLETKIGMYVDEKRDEMEESYLKKHTGRTSKELQKIGIDASVDEKVFKQELKDLSKKLGVKVDYWGDPSIKASVEKVIEKYDYDRAMGRDPELKDLLVKVEGMLAETESKLGR